MLAVVAAVVLVVLVVVGLVVASRGGDGSGGAGSSTGSASSGSSTPDTTPRTAAQVESVWGMVTDVPTGTDQAPSPFTASARSVDCGGTLRCAATEVDGDAVVAYPAEEGTVVVERIEAADGSSTWTEPVDTPASNVALAPAGDVILLVTSEDDPDVEDSQETLRTYRALDPGTGGVIWGPTAFDDDRRAVRALDQPSISTSILAAVGADGPEAIALDNTTGAETWTQPGRVLATDDTSVYLADGGAVVARDLARGDETWRQPVPVDEDGVSPITRLGVVIDDVLVTVSVGEVLGLATGDGTEAWDQREPLSEGADQLDIPLAVSAAGGVAVVVGQTGDMGVDPQTGTVAWRTSRAPLLVPGESNIWVGTADRLVVGQLGDTLRLIATAQQGEELESIEVGPLPPSLSSFAFQGGVAVLTDAGITAFSTQDLSVLWTDPSAAGARTLVTVDGGVVVLGPDGVTLLAG